MTAASPQGARREGRMMRMPDYIGARAATGRRSRVRRAATTSGGAYQPAASKTALTSAVRPSNEADTARAPRGKTPCST